MQTKNYVMRCVTTLNESPSNSFSLKGNTILKTFKDEINECMYIFVSIKLFNDKSTLIADISMSYASFHNDK